MVNNRKVVLVARREYSNPTINTWAVAIPLVPRAITISQSTALDLTEGNTASYTVRLEARPTANVTVRVESNNTDVTVQAGSNTAGARQDLTFEADDTNNRIWSTAQTVTVEALSDGDALDETAMLSHTVRSGSAPEYSGSTRTVTVNVMDDDPGLEVSPRAVTVHEGGAGASYTVALNTAPTGDVTLTLTTSPTGAVTVAPAMLTYDATTWNTAQAVTVSPTTAANDTDGVDETETVRHAAGSSDSNYTFAARTEDDVTVTVDDDETPGVTVDTDLGTVGAQTTLRVMEPETAGAVGTYTLVLNAGIKAGGDVGIESRADADGVVQLTASRSPVVSRFGSVAFFPNTWNTAQTVTVHAQPDADGADAEVELNLRIDAAAVASGYPTTLTIPSVTVIVEDKDTPAVVVDTDPGTDGVQTTPLRVTEEDPTDGSRPYTVALATEPTAAVTLTLATSPPGAVTVGPATLTYDASNWQTAQTVTATAVADGNQNHETVTVTHTLEGAREYVPPDLAASAVPTVSVAVTDNDGPRLVVSRGTGTLALVEGGSAQAYGVQLGVAPQGDVVVRVSSADGDAVSVNTAGGTAAAHQDLTFTATTWNTAQAITLAAVEDEDGRDGRATITHAVRADDSSDEYDGVPDVTFTATVTDDDARLMVSPRAVTVQEGGSGESYTVALSRVPNGDVTVSLSVAPRSSGTVTVTPTVRVAPAALTFDATTWNTAQAVTVSPTAAADDPDGADETETVRHAAAAGSGDSDFTFTARTEDDVTVTVDDDETPGVTLSAPTVAVDEDPAADGGTTAHEETYTVVLAAGLKAGETVRVEVSSGDPAAVRVGAAGGTLGSTAAVTFTSSNWNTAQAVTVQAQTDGDLNNEEVTLSHAITTASVSSGYPTMLSIATVTVTVEDNNAAAVVVDTDPGTDGVQTATLRVTEEDPTDGSRPYTVALGAEPTAPVTLTLATTPTGAVTVGPARLTYDASNWQTAQTVTATAVADGNTDSETVTVTHTPEGAVEYVRGAGVRAVTVAVTDDDAARLVVSRGTGTLAFGTLALVEGGNARAYGVQLGLAPAGDVVVRVSSDDVGAVRVNQAGGTAGTQQDLTFTTATWNTAQTIMLSAVVDDNPDNERVTITHAVQAGDSSDEYDGAAAVTFTVTVSDGHNQNTYRSGAIGNNIQGVSGSVLGTVGSKSITVRAASSSFIWSSMRIYACAKTATPTNDAFSYVTGCARLGNSGDIQSNVTTSVPVTQAMIHNGGFVVVATYFGNYVTHAQWVPIVAPPWIVLSRATALPVDEGSAASYTVQLRVEPTGDVTLQVTSDNTAVVEVSKDGGSAAESVDLGFSTSTWNTAQVVTVSAGADADGANATATLTHSIAADDSADEYDEVPDVPLTVAVTDVDPRGVTLSGSPLTVPENMTGTYTVVLDTQPVGGTVTVTATSADVAAATVENPALEFTASTWATAQTVTVAGTDDQDPNDENVDVTHTAVGGDYTATDPAPVTLAVTVTDDDTPGLRVSAAADGLTVAENASGTYTVALATQPTGGTVTVGIAQVAPNADISANPSGTSALVFDMSTWATAQPVTVTAQADADAGDDTTTLRHTVTGSGDADYPTSLTAVEVAVTVDDAQTATVTVSATQALTLTEDDPAANSATYTVVVDPVPTADVVVTLTTDPAGKVTVVPGALTFTTTDWQTAQTVEATAVGDADAEDAEVRLTHTLTGAEEYAAVPVADVAVTVEDDEDQEVWVDPDTMQRTRALTVAEDGETEYPVTLGSEPTDTVIVRIGVADGGSPDVHALPGLLQFSASTWDTAQTVTVRADGDADARADTATLTHTAAGGDYTGVAAATGTVTVTVTDDDAAVESSRQAVTVLEGEENTYTVRLAAAPAGPVTVTATSGDAAVAPVAPAALTFGPTTWATAQAVTVTGGTVTATASVTVTHTAAGYGPGARAATVEVTVEDTDAARVTVDPRRLRVVEGGAGETYRVALTTDPLGPVTVAVSVTGATNADVSAGPGSLTFETATWETGQAVTVTAGSEVGNTAAGTATVSHTVTAAAGSPYAGVSAPVVSVTEIEDVTPTLGTVPAQTVRAGQRVNVRLPAATGGNLPLRYTLTPPLPAGLTFTETTRRIQGTPQMMAAAATYTLTVTDADGDTADDEFTLTVEANPLGFSAPSVQEAARYALNEEVPAQSFPVLAAEAGTTAAELTFVVEPRLPAGLTYVPPTGAAPYSTGGQIAGTPTEETASRSYTLTVVDGAGNEAVLEFALATEPAPQVSPGPAPDPGFGPPPGPTDPGPPTPGPTCGDAVVAAQEYRAGAAIAALVLPAATGGMGPLRYGVGPGLPAGLTYTAPTDPTATGGVLTGVPVGAQAATAYTLTATEADGAETALLTFTIRVAGPGQIRGQAGTRTYALGGRAVTVTQAAGTLAGVELTLPGRLAQDVAIRLRPPGPDVPLTRGRYGFGPAGAQAAVEMAVTPVPAGGLDVCVPVPADVRAAARERAVQLVRYVGGRWARWARVAKATTEPDRVCGAGLTWFGPLAVGYANAMPTFGERTIAAQTGMVAAALTPVALPAATGGDGPVRYALAPALPAGLSYTLPTEAAAGMIAGVPTEAQPVTTYTLTATDVDGDAATLAFRLAVESEPVEVSVTDATGQEGMNVEFGVTLSWAVAKPVTVQWTAARPGSATPGEDYRAEAAGRLVLAAGATTGTLAVPTLDDRRVEPPETFTVTVQLPDEAIFAATPATATGRIEDDDTEQARKRSVGMVLAGVGRTLATDAVDVIGDRFIQHPTTPQATVGGQALHLRRAGDTVRWRHATGVAYGVARALGVEVGSPLEGGAGEFGQVRGAAWSALTRQLRDPHAATASPRDPHAATAPLSDWDTPATFAAPTASGWGSPPAAPSIWGTPTRAGAASAFPLPSLRQAQGPGEGRVPRGGSGAGEAPFGSGARPGLAGYGDGLGQRAFDRAHAATPQALQVGRFRTPVQFRRVSGTEVLAQSAFEMPLRRAASGADPGVPGQPGAPAAQAAAAAWTLWGRGTASGFDGKPKADFSMDGDVFTGYLGLDYRLQPNVLLGLAVAHSQGDVDYETTDVTKGAVDITLTSILPYAHWSPRPGLGVWGLFGAGWGDLQLRDEAGKVKTDLEMLMGAVGARQEVLTWRQIDVALKADAFLTELEAGADDRLPKTAGDAQRLRLMVEGRTAWAMSEDAHLTPIFEIGGRWDGGKAETGVGAELGGGVEYAHTKLGLGIEARGRYLLAHQKSAFDEWGASLTLKLDPGADKRGLWLALAPVWGAEASQVEQMWGSADVVQAGADAATKPGLSPAQVEFDVGYGLVTYEGAGLLTTYGGVSMAGPDSNGYRLGGRIELGEWIDLSVEGERTTQAGGAEHQVALYSHLGW